MFQTLREPPKKGSLRESVLLLFVLKKEEIGYMRDLAAAQVQLDPETGLKRFKEYQQKMFPWVEVAKGRDRDTHMKALMDELKKGPLSITAVHSPVAKSRLVTRKKEGEHKLPRTPQQTRKMNEFYKRLGKAIPV